MPTASRPRPAAAWERYAPAAVAVVLIGGLLLAGWWLDLGPVPAVLAAVGVSAALVGWAAAALGRADRRPAEPALTAAKAAGVDANASEPAPAPEPAADEPPLEQILDWDEAIAHVGDDPDLFRDLVVTFLDQYPRWHDAIRAALDRADAGALRAAAHPLKGSLGMFAAKAAHAAAQQLETLGCEGNLADGRAALDNLEREMRRLTPALAAFARRPPAN